VQSRRNAKAAKRLMRKLIKGQIHPPRVMITDKLRSYGAAKRDIMPGVEHRSHKGLNNRAENSHQPTPRREWRVSSQPDISSVSFQFMTLSPIFFTFQATRSHQTIIANCEPKPCSCGTKSHAWKPHKLKPCATFLIGAG
jgi:putative transposase